MSHSPSRKDINGPIASATLLSASTNSSSLLSPTFSNAKNGEQMKLENNNVANGSGGVIPKGEGQGQHDKCDTVSSSSSSPFPQKSETEGVDHPVLQLLKRPPRSSSSPAPHSLNKNTAGTNHLQRTMSSFGCSDEGDVEGEEDESVMSYEESLEEGTLRYMKGTGFLAQLKGEISKYLYETTKSKLECFIVPDRADKEILSQIYAYLQWVGMRSTAAVLLSETPVEVLEGTREEGQQDEAQRPKLIQMFTKREEKNESNLSQLEDIPQRPIVTTLEQMMQTMTLETVEIGNQTPPFEEMELKSVETISKSQEVESIPSVANKHLFSAHRFSGDLLTGSPLSSPVASVAKFTRPFLSKETAKIPFVSGEKKESFENLLMAYVGNNSDDVKEIVKVGSSNPSLVELGKPLLESSTSPPESLHKTPSSEPLQKESLQLMGFASTVIASTSMVDNALKLNTTTTPSTDATFTIGALSSEQPERSFFSKQIQKHPDSPESSWSSTSISVSKEKKEEESPLSNNMEKSLPLGDKVERKQVDGLLQSQDQEQDVSTSDAVSLDIELEEDNENTQDISLSSDAKGMSFCEHVVDIK